MTANQIAWFNATEQQRANYARERELNRSNLAQETETNRSNLARENEQRRSNLEQEKARVESNRIALLQQQSQERYNTSQTQINKYLAEENARHNAAMERLQQQNADIQAFQAENSRNAVRVQELQAKAAQLNASTNLFNAETQRMRVKSQNVADVWNNQLNIARTNLTNRQADTETYRKQQVKHETAQGWVSAAANALRAGASLLGI